jgi:hypothetical protein
MLELFGNSIKTLLALTLALASISALAEGASETENKLYYICKNQKEVRTMRVHIETNGTCVTYYSKQGAEKNVGSGKNHESCEHFLDNIKTNLEKSNWNCRDISSTKITSLE